MKTYVDVVLYDTHMNVLIFVKRKIQQFNEQFMSKLYFHPITFYREEFILEFLIKFIS